MQIVTLFIDTNGFIQLRDLKDLPWRDLFPGVKQVRIMVAQPVIKELGNFKTGPNQRRRDRARAALRLIDEASAAPGRLVKIRDKEFTVTLEIAPRKRPDWDSLSDLDPNEPDDRLVAAAMTYGNDAAIFSHDSGPRITAHDLGLEAHEPLEDWHLKPEQSDTDKRITLLERQLKAAQSTKPQIKIEIEGRDPAGKLTLYRPIVPPLDSVAVDRIVTRYIAEHARESPIPAHPMLAGSGQYLTDDQVSRYHRDFDSFERRVRSFFERLHEQLPYWVAVPIVRVTTTNAGSVSATNFHVSLEASAEIGLAGSAKDIRKMCPFPEPPEEPRPRGLFGLSHHDLIRPMNIKDPHPTKMVWIDRPKLGDSFGQYGCKDFQPERQHERDVVLWRLDALPVTGMLTVTAGANDVADISESVKITIEEREEAWHSDLVAESLPEYLRTELRALKWDSETYEKLKKIGSKVKSLTKLPQSEGNEEKGG